MLAEVAERPRAYRLMLAVLSGRVELSRPIALAEVELRMRVQALSQSETSTFSISGK